jgi:hypothetical protein
MRCFLVLSLIAFLARPSFADDPGTPGLIARPDAFQTLVNPACSHCRDEAKRRAAELKDTDRVLAWTRGYSEGGAIPIRFFLAPYRVISDSYGVFVNDVEAGYVRGFAPSYQFRFHGWRNGVMVMKHEDGTLFSCLTGVAFDGPGKGTRLKAIPTLVSDWGFWLEKYPNAVAYHMFDKYKPVELTTKEEPDSVKSRAKPDPRLKTDERVLGIWSGKSTRAFPLSALERSTLINEIVDGEPLVVLWEPRTKTASAYRPVASQPRKYKAPQPDSTGVSKLDEGVPLPIGTSAVPPRKLTLRLLDDQSPRTSHLPTRIQDAETKSFWDVAGRCVSGELQGWTLEWVDSVQVKWFAWAAEYPRTTLYGDSTTPPVPAADPGKKIEEIAGKAEFLRLLPKPFATLKAVDAHSRTVSLLFEGETVAKVWPVEPDAEVKVNGWWGRLDQFRPGQRVWTWLKLDRKKQPVSVVMLADELSEFDMHSSLRKKAGEKPRFTDDEVAAKRAAQKTWLRERWARDGLPGTLTFNHIFSGELEITLDHEAMRWGRSLKTGDTIHFTAEPPIKGVVKAVSPWRERTLVRVVVGELQASELKTGQRLELKMTPPSQTVDDSTYPSDIDRPRTGAERVEWFLASIYCTCGVSKDVCTGHFYTLASCNPNGCGMPNHMRDVIREKIDKKLSDRQIFDELVKESGPLLLRPHLMP